MKIIALGFGHHEKAKEEIKNFITWNFDEGNYKAVAKTSKSDNIIFVEIYRIGSSAKIYEIDVRKAEGYVIHRKKRIETDAICTVHSDRMFDRWNNINKHRRAA